MKKTKNGFMYFAIILSIIAVLLLFYTAYEVIISEDEETLITDNEIDNNVIEEVVVIPNKEELVHYTTHLAGPYHKITTKFDDVWENDWQRAHKNMLKNESVYQFKDLGGVASKNDVLIQQLDDIYLDGLTEESQKYIENFIKEMKEAINYQKRVINEGYQIYKRGSITEDDYIYILNISDKRDAAYSKAKTSFNQFKAKNGIE